MTKVTRRFIPQSLLSNDSKPNTYMLIISPQCEIKTFQRLQNHPIFKIRTLTTSLTPFFTQAQEHCLCNVFEARKFVSANIKTFRTCRSAVSSNNLPSSYITVLSCASRKSADIRWVSGCIVLKTGLKKAVTNPSHSVFHSSIKQWGHTQHINIIHEHEK